MNKSSFCGIVIDSILLELPVPSVFFAKDQVKPYEEMIKNTVARNITGACHTPTILYLLGVMGVCLMICFLRNKSNSHYDITRNPHNNSRLSFVSVFYLFMRLMTICKQYRKDNYMLKLQGRDLYLALLTREDCKTLWNDFEYDLIP